MQFLSVYGLVDNPAFQRCVDAATFVNAKYPDKYNVTVNMETPIDYRLRRQLLAADGLTAKPSDNATEVLANSGPDAIDMFSMDVVVVDEKQRTVQPGDDFVRDVERNTTFRVASPPAGSADSYESRAHRMYITFLRDRGNRYCWMDVAVDNCPLGRVTFELYSKLTPHTSQNFWRLCKGDLGEVMDGEEAVRLTYEGTRFFRVLKDAWVMGGDVSGSHGGNGGYSCYGRFFPDECLAVHHDSPGVLGMCNDGAHSNASSFYITRKKMSWMDGKYVAFGRVIDGMEVVDAIHAVPVKHNQAPTMDVVVTACGVIDPTM